MKGEFIDITDKCTDCGKPLWRHQMKDLVNCLELRSRRIQAGSVFLSRRALRCVQCVGVWDEHSPEQKEECAINMWEHWHLLSGKTSLF